MERFAPPPGAQRPRRWSDSLQRIRPSRAAANPSGGSKPVFSRKKTASPEFRGHVPDFGTPDAFGSWHRSGKHRPVACLPRLRGAAACVPVVAEESLMNFTTGSGARAGQGRWSLTQADVLLCALPIAVFLSIVSLV